MSPAPEQIGHDPETNRDLLLWAAEDAQECVELSGALPAGPFVCLLAWDAAAEATESISILTDTLVRRGCVYLCTWGTDCERVHDICDWGIVEMEIDNDRSDLTEDVVMTTWHSDQPLEEALWFFLRCAVPTENYANSCRTGLALTIGACEERLRIIHAALSNPEEFANEQ